MAGSHLTERIAFRGSYKGPISRESFIVTVRWEFMYPQDGSRWSWRRIAAHGSIESTSEPFPGFGKAVANAVKQGFHPKEDHWVINSGGWTTHFDPKWTPIAIGPKRQSVRRSQPDRRKSQVPVARDRRRARGEVEPER